MGDFAVYHAEKLGANIQGQGLKSASLVLIGLGVD
jgi:hypothetical protein